MLEFLLCRHYANEPLQSAEKFKTTIVHSFMIRFFAAVFKTLPSTCQKKTRVRLNISQQFITQLSKDEVKYSKQEYVHTSQKGTLPAATECRGMNRPISQQISSEYFQCFQQANLKENFLRIFSMFSSSKV